MKVIAQEVVAQVLAAQAPPAHGPLAQDPVAQSPLAQTAPAPFAQPQHAQAEQAFAQLRHGHETFAQAEVPLTQAETGLAQHTGLLAQEPLADGGLRMPGEDDLESADRSLGNVATTPEPIPAARVSRLDAEVGSVITQQTDAVRIPEPWVEGFRDFIRQYGKHPEQEELANFLYTRGMKARGKDAPVSLESVRRYYGHLQAMFPLEDQQQLHLAELTS